MREILVIMAHEFRAFRNSGKSSFFLIVITALVWGAMISSKVDTIEDITSFMWVIFFALVAGAGLSTTVFVRERLSATLEVLIMSGIERRNILFGKLLFTTTMSSIIGLSAFVVAYVIQSLVFQGGFFHSREIATAGLIFISASCMVNSSSALFTMALSNPRLVQFFNFTLLTIISLGYGLISTKMERDFLFGLAGVMFFLSVVFTLISLRLFRSEKIIQPLIY